MRIQITEEQYKKLIEGFVPFPVDEDIALEVWEDKDKLELTTIVIPKHLRGEGKGTEIMNMVIKYSNEVNKPIYLTPDTSFGGTSIGRLKRFYSRFGFEKNKDYEVTHSMVRYPNTLQENEDNGRRYIDWEENYNRTFRIVRTPEGKQDHGEWTPDLISIVTPENGDSWFEWEDVPKNVLRNWRRNWDEIQKHLGDHKYNQIIRSMNNR